MPRFVALIVLPSLLLALAAGAEFGCDGGHGQCPGSDDEFSMLALHRSRGCNLDHCSCSAEGINVGCAQVWPNCGCWSSADGLDCQTCCPTPTPECRTAAAAPPSGNGTIDYGSVATIALTTGEVGVKASGCLGPTKIASDHLGFVEPSPLMSSMFFRPAGACGASAGFFMRAPEGSASTGCVHYGDVVVIGMNNDIGASDDAGMSEMGSSWGGPAGVLVFLETGSTMLYLRPPAGSGKTGCIQQGDAVVIAQTADQGNSANCGWYGCRVAQVTDLSGYPSMAFDHGGDSPTTFILSAPVP